MSGLVIGLVATDVQAPGHPLLRLMRIHVDRVNRVVREFSGSAVGRRVRPWPGVALGHSQRQYHPEPLVSAVLGAARVARAD